MEGIAQKAPLIIATIALCTSIYGWLNHQTDATGTNANAPLSNSETPQNRADFNENGSSHFASELANLEKTLSTLTEQSQARWTRYLSEQQNMHAHISDIKNSIQTLDDDMQSQISNILMDQENLNGRAMDYHANKKGPISESALGDYIDQALDNQSLAYDEPNDQAHEAIAQTQALMTQLPGVTLNNMQCGSGYCRAAFARIDGETPKLDSLWGQPPFINQIVEVPQDDGSVLLYFTEAGVSMDDIRAEAETELALVN